MTILLIEDDIRISQLVQRALELEGYRVLCAYDGVTGKNFAIRNSPDLIILDVMLPIYDGLSLCKELKSSNISVPILMLTALGSTDDKLDGFDAGADDYMVKPFEIRELIARVRVLTLRYKGVKEHTSIINYSNLEINIKTKEVKRDNNLIKLTPKEFKLLEFLLTNRERVVSKVEIAQNVWNTHYDTGTNYIDVYINYLRKKIDLDYSPKLIHTRAGMGFIFTKDYENTD